MRRHVLGPVSMSFLALTALLLGACTSNPATDASSGGPPSPPPSTAIASPTAPPPSPSSPSPTATASPSGSTLAAALEDGRHFGFIQSVDAGAPAMVFDLAEFLTGDAANQAAIEDGVIQPGQTIDNDYYIRNRNPRLRDLVLTPDVQIILVNWPNCCETTVNGVLSDFAASFTTPDDVYHGPQSPYWLTVDGGLVTKIEEQYLP
jgi:hypothetical protein